MKPAVSNAFLGGVRSVEITLDHRCTLDPQLTHFANRQEVAIVIDATGFKAWHGRAAAGGLIDEKVSANGGDDAAGLGHAIARIGSGRGNGGINLGNQIGLKLCATATQSEQARRISRGKIGVHDDFAGHRRYATHRRHLFGLNQAQRFSRIPFVHQHHGATARRGDIGGAIIGGDVEEGRRDQANRWIWCRHAGRVNAIGAHSC